MKTLIRILFVTASTVVLAFGAAGPALACGTMDSFFDVFIDVGEEGNTVTTTMGNITVTAEAGQTCFIATNLPAFLPIVAVRFNGPNGGEFATFVSDPTVAAAFGQRYRAFSAVALQRVDLSTFTLEVDVQPPTPSIGLPRVGSSWIGASIAAGQTDGAGQIIDHASIVNLRKVEINLASP